MRIALAVALAVGLGVVFSGTWVAPRTARCAFCFNGPCYSSSICGRDCVCLKKGLDVSGYCYSSD